MPAGTTNSTGFVGSQAACAGLNTAANAPAAKTAIGLAVADLTDAQKKELKLHGGVRVESVEGAAARAGVREGDVIVTLDNAEVSDAKQFNAQVTKLDKNKAVSVMVRRGNWTNYLVIRPTAAR